MDTLALHSLNLWLKNARDPRGGAYGFLDRKFCPQVDQDTSPQGPSGEVRGDKSLIQQARHLYTYSFVYERRGGGSELQAFADSIFYLLMSSFSAGEGKPLYHQLKADHTVRDVRVQIYAQSFAVFGLATYARVFGNRQAAEKARGLFLHFDSVSHDDENGGYDQLLDGGWLVDIAAPKAARKCTNTHIHVLEALIALCTLFPDDEHLRGRLQELVHLISTRLLQPSGYVHKYFLLDWKPVGASECSYGHDLETSWLLVEAAAFCDDQTRLVADQAATTMADNALRCGWDEKGGVFDSGLPELASGAGVISRPARVTGHEKVWWVQAESLPGIYRLYVKKRDAALVRKLAATLSFLSDRSWDTEFGEFYWGVDALGTPGPRGEHKGELWKTPYHAQRALILTADWIRGTSAEV